MGEVFERQLDGNVAAEWVEEGRKFELDYSLTAEEIPAFTAWLQEGPPTPKWRIVREFDEKPVYVTYEKAQGVAALTDDDVEVVG